jgi:hypothetical protein
MHWNYSDEVEALSDGEREYLNCWQIGLDGERLPKEYSGIPDAISAWTAGNELHDYIVTGNAAMDGTDDD